MNVETLTPTKISVKKIVVKKPKAPKTVKFDQEKPVAAPTVKKSVKKSVEKPTKKVLKSSFDRLNAHAMKHVTNWHAKAGENGTQFAKLLAKHARSLLK